MREDKLEEVICLPSADNRIQLARLKSALNLITILILDCIIAALNALSASSASSAGIMGGNENKFGKPRTAVC